MILRNDPELRCESGTEGVLEYNKFLNFQFLTTLISLINTNILRIGWYGNCYRGSEMNEHNMRCECDECVEEATSHIKNPPVQKIKPDVKEFSISGFEDSLKGNQTWPPIKHVVKKTEQQNYE